MFVIVDQNKTAIDYLESRFPYSNRIFCGDIIKYQQKNGGYIMTASNPSFNPGGGLDAALNKAGYWDDTKAIRRRFNGNLFYWPSVTNEYKADVDSIREGLAVAEMSDELIFITCLGTGIGGLTIAEFGDILEPYMRCDVVVELPMYPLSKFKSLYTPRLRSNEFWGADSVTYKKMKINSIYNIHGFKFKPRYNQCRIENVYDVNNAFFEKCKIDVLQNVHDCKFKNCDLSSAAGSLVNCELVNCKISHELNLFACNSKGSRRIGKEYIDFSKFFKITKKGMRVYKAIGHTYYKPPKTWEIKENSYLSEIVNNSTNDCGGGVSFATLDYIFDNFSYWIDEGLTTIWECLIEPEDMKGIVVHNRFVSEQKARCERLKLIRPLTLKKARAIWKKEKAVK